MAVFRVPATITWSGPGSPGVNVWSVRTVNASIVLEEIDAALTALQAFYTSLADQYPSGTKISLGPDIVERQSLEDASRPERVINSTGVEGPQAHVLQVCIGWRTSLRARRGMGRTFIGPLRLGVVDASGTPGSTVLTDVQNAAQTLVDASGGTNSWAVGVWGLQNVGQYDSTGRLVPGQPHVHRDITGFKVRDRFAVLRSRRD
jgi:hypothetical protein